MTREMGSAAKAEKDDSDTGAVGTLDAHRGHAAGRGPVMILSDESTCAQGCGKRSGASGEQGRRDCCRLDNCQQERRKTPKSHADTDGRHAGDPCDERIRDRALFGVAGLRGG